MKLLAFIIFVFAFALSISAQNKMSLDKKLSAMHEQNFSDWTAENADQAFYPMTQYSTKFNPKTDNAANVSYLHSVWTKDKKQVKIRMKIIDEAETETKLQNFWLRNISPPHYKIKDLGGGGVLVKFYNRVEIAFVKFNVFTRINHSFSKKRKKYSFYGKKMYRAPQTEVDFAMKIARRIADEITEIQTIETLTGVQLQPAAN